MAEFKIGRIRYTWKGTWAAATEYIRDDVVRYAGTSYVCLVGHTSTSNFYTDKDVAQPRWTSMTEGSTWRGAWTTSTYYNLGDIVEKSGSTYICVTPHSSGTFSSDYAANWDDYILSENWRGDWVANTDYYLGDIVRFSGITYKCILNHTSTSNQKLETASLAWETYVQGTDQFNSWQANISYKYNDRVKYGGSIWKANQSHVGQASFSSTYWDVELPGYQFSSDWSNSTVYQFGDIVRYGGELFYSNIDNNGIEPRDPTDSTITWVKLAKGYNPRGDWIPGTLYIPGDVVRRGGDLYVCLTETSEDYSTLDYLDTSNWEKLVPSNKWRNRWAEDISYQEGDIVIYNGGAYRCDYAHLSTDQNFPGDNGSGYAYWSTYAQPGDHTAMHLTGDLVTYNLNRTASGDGSTLGPIRLPIGDENQVLMVDNDSSPFYKKFAVHTKDIWVASSGIDDITEPGRGFSLYLPFKTIRYACEAIETLGITGNVNITVLPGYYEEITPIIVPAGVCIKGEEVRGVTVVPNSPIDALASDSTYTIAVLTRLRGIIDNIISGIDFTPTPGNSLTQNKTVTGSSTASTTVFELINNIIDYINFYINSTGSDPVMSGSNTARTTAGYLNAITALENNKEFLAAEAVAFMQQDYPLYSFDSEKCKRDVRRFIDSWKYDLLYPGNYKSLWAARYYRNAVLGSSSEDMWYLRDATGLRNMTFKGLVGSLNPPGVFDYYQVPTGATYVGFDPGWGPDDSRTWITSRSPYIQNCVTFGTGSTGNKLDGSLHNGGNKSMVSNDFTQIINEGIGVHVLNGARAELVSIFTYYSHVGYLAENGGIIRATNGNNSYGTYGAMAIGQDSNEVPRYGTVNTRNNQAEVAQTFVDSELGGIFALEWANAGQNYTSANLTIRGSGVNGTLVAEDFRDDAVFESLLYGGGDSSAIIGGGGYTNLYANAQTGTTTTIKLSATDPNNESEYLGMRLFIRSGVGCGQYGYITHYDTVTKIVTVARESDGQPGWDHILPGYPIATLLQSSTRYSIEPRVTFSAPSYSTDTVTLPSTQVWANVVYGETYKTFTAVTGGVGTGSVESQDGLTPITATWDVVKNGRDYTLSINNRGAGYEAGQQLTILGSILGGSDGDNDIVINITQVSEDSTNSIISFTYRGTGASGVFVATPSSGTDAAYSYDGITWTTTTLPASGDWNILGAGNNMFVAAVTGTTTGAYSYDGITWTAFTTPPSARAWTGIAYGNGKWVMVSSSNSGTPGAYSSNGKDWTMSAMSLGDSTNNQWVDVCYGKGKFFAVANNNNLGATSTNGITWTVTNVDAGDSAQVNWVSVTYGQNKWVAMSSEGYVAYSFDADAWYLSTLPTQDGSTIMNWKKIRYAQGVFVAICDTTGLSFVGGDAVSGTSKFIATSENIISWTGREVTTSNKWRALAFGNPDVTLGDSTVKNNRGIWIVVPENSSATGNYFRLGARAKGQVDITSGIVTRVKIWDPGSGYDTEPLLTLTDPNNTSEAITINRLGDGVIGTVSVTNTGYGYRTDTTTTTVLGNGFADIIPDGKILTISNLTVYPKIGAQLRFAGNETKLYSIARLEKLGDLGDGTLSAEIQISPSINVDDYYVHDTDIEIREKYSQCRITGHDYLDVGTGNFLETNYPELYSGSYYYSPENEVVEKEGGRVFYTSTDQNGNFRAGELFAVEQATGIVTISADFFDFAGLTELRLGGVRIGGSGVIIREFSTDPLFSEDSNNVIPTQRAIKAYLQSRLSVSGSDVVINGITAGQVSISGQSITHALYGSSGTIIVLEPMNFTGSAAGIQGSIMAQTMFYASFTQDGQ